MGRKNHRGGSTQQPTRRRPKTPPLSARVQASGSCPSGKRRFATAEIADLALRQAQLRREGRGDIDIEKRYYGGPKDPCEHGCGGYHLTKLEKWVKA